MHPEKRAAVTALEGPERYSYFVRKVTDTQVVWGLRSGGWASAANDQGVKALPFWPEEDFALSCARSEWAKFEPSAIPLSDFLERWLSGMGEDGLLVAVFPTAQSRGVFVEPSQLKADLKAEMAQYE